MQTTVRLDSQEPGATRRGMGGGLPRRDAWQRERVGRLAERGALWLLWLVSAGALAGFALFTRRPALLNEIPGAAAAYARMFTLAPRAQIVLAFGALAFFLARRTGARWLPAFAATYLLSLGSELAGTTVGLPFGPYRYTDGLGPKLFGHVPVLIPLSWFFMALPSYAIAARRFAGDGWRHALPRIGIASFILLSWDLALDPAMSFVTKYWVWGTTGAYYGMPLLNLFGWYVTGLVLMAAFALLRADRWVAALPTTWLAGFYGANLLLPVGMSLAGGHEGAVVATLAALVGCAVLVRRANASRPAGDAGAAVEAAGARDADESEWLRLARAEG